MRWVVAVVIFSLVEAAQFRFECSTNTSWCLVLGAPLSLAAGLTAARLLMSSGRDPARRVRFWIFVGLLALLGVPAYFLGHICR